MPLTVGACAVDFGVRTPDGRQGRLRAHQRQRITNRPLDRQGPLKDDIRMDELASAPQPRLRRVLTKEPGGSPPGFI